MLFNKRILAKWIKRLERKLRKARTQEEREELERVIFSLRALHENA